MTLFAGYDPPEPPPRPDAGLSADAARTVRQRQAIAAGAHPLSLVVPLALHPQAPTDAQRTDRGRAFTCGTCVHRIQVLHNNGTYPKCDAGSGRRLSRGGATDVRAWWPACTDYQPTGGP